MTNKVRDTTLPTDAELAILDVLWQRGPSTVRQVHEQLTSAQEGRGTGYTTTLKLMQIMAAKGLLNRDESRRSHVYKLAAGREQTQGSLVRNLMDKAFGGSASAMAMRALSTKPPTADELNELKQMLEDLEKKQ